jgi:hypothetical protein
VDDVGHTRRREQLQRPPAGFADCVVHLNGGVRPTWLADDKRFAVFCKQIAHEFGHLEGRPDIGALAGTVESERPDLARVPVCERYRLVHGHRIYRGRPASSRATRVRRAHRRRL